MRALLRTLVALFRSLLEAAFAPRVAPARPATESEPDGYTGQAPVTPQAEEEQDTLAAVNGTAIETASSTPGKPTAGNGGETIAAVEPEPSPGAADDDTPHAVVTSRVGETQPPPTKTDHPGLEAPNGASGESTASVAGETPVPLPGDDIPGDPLQPVPAGAGRTSPRKYISPAGGAPPPRQPPRTCTGKTGEEPVTSKERPAPVEVLVYFEHGSYCRVALLPKRPAGLPEELTLTGSPGSVELEALDEDWYQDVVPDGFETLLRDGLIWTDTTTGQEWALSGRELFVLAAGTEHSFFVSCSRLVIGREHVVLCTASILPAAEEVLQHAGCREWTHFGERDGVPSGWVVLRGIIPQNPVPLEESADILNVIRPLPGDVEIQFEGGIRLRFNSWLCECPPSIFVYGDPDHTREVLIDGQEATASAGGSYTAPGWDEERSHEVWCAGKRRAYSLVRCRSNWGTWPEFSFPLRSSRGDGDCRLAICGPLVRPESDTGELAGGAFESEVIQVPPANPVLLGPKPGEVFVAARRSDVRGALCIASPPFAAVWALPAQPLLCKKSAGCVLLAGDPVPPDRPVKTAADGGDLRGFTLWYKLILDACRKGLAVEPAIPAARELWHQYKAVARDLWRASK